VLGPSQVSKIIAQNKDNAAVRGFLKINYASRVFVLGTRGFFSRAADGNTLLRFGGQRAPVLANRARKTFGTLGSLSTNTSYNASVRP